MVRTAGGKGLNMHNVMDRSRQSVICVIPARAEVQVLELLDNDTWAHIRYDGVEGYVLTDYLRRKAGGESGLVPVQTATAVEMCLRCNPSAGEDWRGVSSDPEVALVSLMNGDSSADDDQRLFVIEGQSRGVALVTFTYSLIWQSGNPLCTISLSVDVDEDLNVVVYDVTYDYGR